MTYELDLFNGTAAHPLADGGRWSHVTGATYNHWGKKTDATPPGGYAYVFNQNGAGLPAVAVNNFGNIADAYVHGDFYDSLPDGTGIAVRVTLSGGGTDWQGFRLVYEAVSATVSNYLLIKRTSGGTETTLLTVPLTHPSGQPPMRLGVLCNGSSLSLYAGDRRGTDTLLGTVTDSFNQTATLHGLYGESEDDQKCDTFEVAALYETDYWLDSFDHWGDPSMPADGDIAQKYHAGNQTAGFECDIVSGFLSGSTGAARFQGTVDGTGIVAVARYLSFEGFGEVRVVTGSYFYFRDYPGGPAPAACLALYSGNADVISVVMGTNGRLAVWEGARFGYTDPLTGGIARSAESAVVPLNTPVLLALHARWEQGTTMHYEVRSGATVLLSGSYATDNARFSYPHLWLDGARIGAYHNEALTTVDFDCDEWYVLPGDYPWITPLSGPRVRCLYPVGAGTYTNWTPVGDTPNWECVDETVINLGTDYVEISATGSRDSYEMGDLPDSDPVHAVQANTSHTRVGTGTLNANAFVRVGTDEADITDISTVALTSLYPVYSGALRAMPGIGTPWTPSDVNAMEAGQYVVSNTDTAGTSVRVTQVTMEVLTGYPSAPPLTFAFGTIIGV